MESMCSFAQGTGVSNTGMYPVADRVAEWLTHPLQAGSLDSHTDVFKVEPMMNTDKIQCVRIIFSYKGCKWAHGTVGACLHYTAATHVSTAACIAPQSTMGQSEIIV
jgi:hypothetical protein